MMEYDTDIDRIADNELIRFFDRGIVHNWVLIEQEANSDDNG